MQVYIIIKLLIGCKYRHSWEYTGLLLGLSYCQTSLFTRPTLEDKDSNPGTKFCTLCIREGRIKRRNAMENVQEWW